LVRASHVLITTILADARGKHNRFANKQEKQRNASRIRLVRFTARNRTIINEAR
jgi:hypothetical protein